MQFFYVHEYFLGYLIGLLIAIAWGRLEVWAYRNPQTIDSNVCLVVFGWLLVPIFIVGYILYYLYSMANYAISVLLEK